MKAGRELDILIAEKVMGWKRLTYAQWKPDNKHYSTRHELTPNWHSDELYEVAWAEDRDDYYYPEDAWSPSTDIVAAWQVFSRLSELTRLDGGDEISLHYENGGGYSIMNYNARWYLVKDCETAPLAICLAALQALKELDKE